MKLKFAAGNFERLSEFIDRLNGKDKIALVSHIDLDGMAAAKVTNEILNTKNIIFVDYPDLNEDLVSKLKKLKVDKVVFTDLSFTNLKIIKGIEKFAKILIIDHHLFDKDLNSDKTTFVNVQGICCGYLCYHLFSKIKNLDKWDWLVACSNVSDWLFMNNQEWLTKVYSKYGDKFNPGNDGIRKGRFWSLQYALSLFMIYFRSNLINAYNLIKEDINNTKNLNKYTTQIQKEIDKCIKTFEKEKQNIYDGYSWEIKSKFPIKMIVINKLSSYKLNKTFVLYKKNGIYCIISARRQDKRYNMAELMKNLTKGFAVNSGGHVAAAGATILAKDINKFKENLFNWKKNEDN